MRALKLIAMSILAAGSLLADEQKTHVTNAPVTVPSVVMPFVTVAPFFTVTL